MKEIIYNDNTLNDEMIHEWVKRAKVLVVNSKDEILIAHTNDSYYFLGGHVENNESDYECLVREIKEEAGIDYTKVVKTTCFLADMADFAAFNEVYAKYITNTPARSCVAVKTLPKNGLVEVEAIAVIE